MAELTRHRLASFSVESTRFNDYSKGELTFIKPCFYGTFFDEEVENPDLYEHHLEWYRFLGTVESHYRVMREVGATPEQARAILPNSLKTEIVMTANLREWRTILKLRTAKDAHPQMRQVANMILAILKEKLPVIFEDIGNEK